MSSRKYTITAALPYANGPLHLGHIAGVYLPADIYTRFLKLQGKDAVYICGSDEHGAAITLRAKKEGITPQEIVDKYHVQIRDSFKDFGIEFDIFHRTSSDLHKKTAQDFFTKLNENGKFTQETTEQYFDEEYQQFLADRYITGECPSCHHPNAYGDQCEKCGSALSPLELIHPISTLSGKTPILKETSHWFLPMERHEDWLRTWIQEGILDGKKVHDPKTWRNQVNGQCMSWIDGGLKPRAMTRDLDWGVKVPLPNSEGKVLYVWLDAPIGYISATKQWALDNNKNWEDYWKNDAKLVHFIGKDNIVFHAVIFPILLKDHGDLVLPENVPASEFLNLEGDKFSTSRNWAVWLHEYLERYPAKVDELKYTLTAIAPESKDSEFTWKEFQTRVNSELADILGNFVNRALVLTDKYYAGKIPALGDLTQEDKELIAQIATFPQKIKDKCEAYKFRDAQVEVMNLARLGNKYLADSEPWKLIKSDAKRVETIMHLALQLTANLASLLAPFLPKTSHLLLSSLGFNSNPWDKAGSVNLISEGQMVTNPGILFPKIEDSLVEAELAFLEASKTTETSAIENVIVDNMNIENDNSENVELPIQKAEISFDEYQKMDIRLVKIIDAVKVPKADKLLQLTVDTGIDIRTIVSGIALHYTPEEIIGKTVQVLLNLAPRKIKGIESQGMVLMVEDKNGKLSFMISEKNFEEGGSVN